jgi:hypothetical protein
MSYAPVYALRDWGATGDGKTDDFDRIGVAQRAVSSGGLRVTRGTYVIGTSMAFTVPLFFDPGAVLKPASGVTLTVSAGLTADELKIFDLSAGGAVAFADNWPAPVRYAAWWGASLAATAATNAAAIQAAIASVTAGHGARVQLSRGQYQVAADVISLVGHRNVELCGYSAAWGYEPSEGATELRFTTGTIGIDIYQTPVGSQSSYNTIRNLWVNGNAVLSIGIRLNAANAIIDTSVSGCRDAGIQIPNFANSTNLTRVSAGYNTGGTGYGLLIQGSSSTLLTVDTCNFRINTVGVRIEGAYNATFRDCVVESNVNEGLYIYKPSGGTVSNLRFENMWLEGNWAAGAGYQCVIDSAVHDYGAGPPLALTFEMCNFNALNSSRHLNVACVAGLDVRSCVMGGGDTTNGLILSDYASYCYFHGAGLTPVGGTYGNRGGRIFKGTNGGDQAGYNTDMPSTTGAATVRATGGDQGGLTRDSYKVTTNITAAATVTIPIGLPAGCRLLGIQFRVDTALAGGETWNAAYSGGSSTALVVAGGIAKNTKVNVQKVDEIATATTNIAITKNAGGSFSGVGTISVYVSYELYLTVADAP